MDGFDYFDYINVVVELIDKMVDKGFGDYIVLIGNGCWWIYKEFFDWINWLVYVLVEDFGVKLGN